tara:strand:+ start:3367 stop:3972 length:606 start_codon:yes stop_codon:yes gene_type:complete
MRARMALSVADIEYEHREVSLRNKPQAMLEASPKGTVPVFITSAGKVIDESVAVMRHALNRHDPENWMIDQTDRANDFIKVMDEDFKPHLDRYKYASRYDETAERGDVNLEHRAAAVEILKKWESALEKHDFLLRDTPSLADIATFPFIRQFAATEKDWWASKPLPRVADWLDRCLNSDLFKKIMKKRPLWEPPQEGSGAE